MTLIDGIVAAILALAALRGILLGLIRETFSIAALAGAVIAVRLATDPLAAWFAAESGVAWSPLTLRVATGFALVVVVIGSVALTGRLLRRGARAAGLGWADRLAGGVLGATEGVLVAGFVLFLALATLGDDHQSLTDSRAVAALERAKQLAREANTPGDVAAPPVLRR